MENSGGKKRLVKKGLALVTSASIALTMAPASFAVDGDTSDPQITTWSTLYSGMGVDTATGYDAVTSATNFTGYHAKDIPAIVHKTAIGESTALDGVTVTEGVLEGTDQAESGSFVYTSGYGSLGEFDIVPYAADKEGYVWNDYIAGLYAATISDGTTTVGAVPWVDYYGEPATTGPHFNKVQIALNNGTSKASNKAEVARYSAFLDENGNMKAGNYTVTLYSEGFNKVTSEITVLETSTAVLTAADRTTSDKLIKITNIPAAAANPTANVTYSYQKEGDKRPTTVTVISDAAVENGVITLEEGALSELAGKTLTITVKTDNYAPMTASCSVKELTDWSTLYSGMGINTATGYDAVTSATNFTGYHAKDIPAIVHKTAIGESTALDGVTVTEGVLEGTDQAESGSFVYTSGYGSLGEFDIVPYAADKEGYVWNDYIAGLYAATISDGTTTVGAVPWVDYYGEPATTGPHFNKVQIALNNGTSKASNKAEVARYSAFLDENGNMKAGTYTVTLYSEGFNKVTSEITVLETFSGDVTAKDVTKTASEITVSGLPEDIQNPTAAVTYSYQKEGDRRPTTVTVASAAAVNNGIIALEEGALSELTGKTLTVTVSSDNYAPIAAACTVTAFKDVKSSAYYYPAVAWAVEKGITTGTTETTFSPEKTCTRAQVVTFLYRAAGEPEVAPTDKFTDVKSGSYYANAVAWAVENGITTGAAATTFNPKGVCDRAQIVTFLARYAKAFDTTYTGKFTDVKDDSYYASAVQWAVDQNITTGVSETEFAPKKDCTRAEAVTFLYRYFSALS